MDAMNDLTSPETTNWNGVLVAPGVGALEDAAHCRRYVREHIHTNAVIKFDAGVLPDHETEGDR